MKELKTLADKGRHWEIAQKDAAEVLQDMIGQCMSLETALEKQGLRTEDIGQARVYLVMAAKRLETPLEVRGG